MAAGGGRPVHRPERFYIVQVRPQHAIDGFEPPRPLIMTETLIGHRPIELGVVCLYAVLDDTRRSQQGIRHQHSAQRRRRVPEDS